MTPFGRTRPPKRWAAAALAAAALASAAHAQCQHWNSILIGDVNLDGVVDVDDLTIIYDNMLLGHTEATWLQGDLNRDGKVDMDDFNLALDAYYANACIDDIPPNPGTHHEFEYISSTNRINIYDISQSPKILIDWFTINTNATPNRFRPHATDVSHASDAHGKIEHTTPTIIAIANYIDGIDLKLVYENPYSDMYTNISGIEFSEVGGWNTIPVTSVWDFRNNASIHRKLDSHQGLTSYPSDQYSPVCVVNSDSLQYGFAFIYPLLDYKHGVGVAANKSLGSSTQSNDYRAFVKFFPNIFLHPNDDVPAGNIVPNGAIGTYNQDALLSPGEVREYIISIRVTGGAEDHDNQWMHTLLPYRRFFQHMYGDVQYVRDNTPMAGNTLAFAASVTDCVSGNNPYGFDGGASSIRDVGFTAHVDRWTSSISDGDPYDGYFAKGYTRLMLWQPSGEYASGGMAWQITSNWLASNYLPCDNVNDRIENTLPLLASVDAPGRQLGLWWGRSTRYVPNGYGGSSFEWPPAGGQAPIDRNLALHRDSAFHELHGAIGVNAKWIGLDATLQYMHGWEAYWWIRQMENEAINQGGQLRFITEMGGFDVSHTIAAMTVLNRAASTPSNPRASIVLADFLNPGHETFGHAGGSQFSQSSVSAKMQAIDTAMTESALDGFISIINMGENTMPYVAPQHKAVESWLFSVPPSLQP